MTFVAVFLINAALSFALSLLVALLVGPDLFGRYAVALSISVVINTVVFEWLRLSTTRFYSERTRAEQPEIGLTLDVAYAASSAAVVLAGGVAIVSGADLGLPPGLLAAAAAVGLSVGIFDYRTAQARALFLDRRYAALLLTRGLLAFALASAAAWLWTDPAAILAGSAAAAAVTLAAVRGRRDGSPPGRFDRALFSRFARYAVPLVAASALYQLLPLLNRTILASRAGFSEAGYFSLASEIAVRLLQNLGNALDLMLFQVAVRAEERGGAAAGHAQAARNLALVIAVIVPGAVGLCVVWPSFEALFVPPSFRGQVAGAMMLAVPAFAAYALIQYGFNPIFQIRRRTGAVIAAALVAVAVNAAVLFAFDVPANAGGVAAVQLAGFAAGLMTIAALSARSSAALPWGDVAATIGAAAVMAAALWPWREALHPALGLPLQALVGVAIYGAFAIVLDIAGTRAFLRTVTKARAGIR